MDSKWLGELLDESPRNAEALSSQFLLNCQRSAMFYNWSESNRIDVEASHGKTIKTITSGPKSKKQTKIKKSSIQKVAKPIEKTRQTNPYKLREQIALKAAGNKIKISGNCHEEKRAQFLETFLVEPATSSTGREANDLIENSTSVSKKPAVVASRKTVKSIKLKISLKNGEKKYKVNKN